MDLVNDGESLTASLALNSHSWVSPYSGSPITYTPYGIASL